jgi:hypothetical protein
LGTKAYTFYVSGAVLRVERLLALRGDGEERDLTQIRFPVSELKLNCGPALPWVVIHKARSTSSADTMLRQEVTTLCQTRTASTAIG